MGKRTDWEVIKLLGGGGQSDVFLVRSPNRAAERATLVAKVQQHAGGCRIDGAADLAEAVWNYARPEVPSELGALKVFKIRPESSTLPPPPGSKEFEAIVRLKNEITALSRDLPGLPKLLGSNEGERWIVTEYFPKRTLEDHPLKYKGKVAPALKAFRSLVQTVAILQKEGYVHRDIKPANVFVRKDDELVLGDFGIVYLPNAQHRVTLTGERVGPRDHMPSWANLGGRHENVHPRDDVYMLGKLLWSMLDGHAVLPREYHKHPEYEFDLTKTFPNEPHMHLINAILDKCIVEQADQCLPGAQELLPWIDEVAGIIEGVPRPCHVCGKGFYQTVSLRDNPQNKPLGLRFWVMGTGDISTIPANPLACDYCGHIELFTTAGWQAHSR
jgi:serine/threonine protein kinase